MKHSAQARVTIIITCLILALSLSACITVKEPDDLDETPDELSTEDIAPAPTQHVTIGNDLFTLRYDPDSSLNPITGTSTDNQVITQLLYEGLFALDSAFEPYPVLCESAMTEDNLVYTITIKSDAVMSDGSTLTAADVAYTLNIARNRGRYVNRLSNIASVSYTDGVTVVITLHAPNTHFTKLLDIPIIKSGTIDYRVPPGTGPYTYVSAESQYLSALAGHRDFADLPVRTIFLSECENAQLIEQFSDGLIDLLWDDPTDSVIFEPIRRHDVRTYNTTVMQFIGFSTRTNALKSPDIRRAIGLAVDRGYITGTIMDGYSLPSPLAFSPAYKHYSTSWERDTGDMLIAISAIIVDIGLADIDDDSHLEFPLPGAGYEDFTLDFIVNSDNAFKLETAEHIAEALRHVGFDVVVTPLNWSDYTKALETGDFDMYIGDVKLNADFDLSPLLLPGGHLDYGKVGDEMYAPYLTAYFTAGSDTAEQIAAKYLCEQIFDNAPFIPISYKRHMMHSGKDAIIGASPSQSSLFFNLTGWTVVPGADIQTPVINDTNYSDNLGDDVSSE